MMIPVSHSEWQSLRALVRAGKPLKGADLRITPTANNKNGLFLLMMVEKRLLRVTELAVMPMEATYEMTLPGKYAAEYGEYDADPLTKRALKMVKKDNGKVAKKKEKSK